MQVLPSPGCASLPGPVRLSLGHSQVIQATYERILAESNFKSTNQQMLTDTCQGGSMFAHGTMWIIYGKGYRAVLRNCEDSQIHERELAKVGYTMGSESL